MVSTLVASTVVLSVMAALAIITCLTVGDYVNKTKSAGVEPPQSFQTISMWTAVISSVGVAFCIFVLIKDSNQYQSYANQSYSDTALI